MRIATLTLLVLALGPMIAGSALAADPVQGFYTSVDLGYGSQDVLTGRGSNSWPAPYSGVGQVFNSASWDGSALGTQWVFTCGVSTSLIVDDQRDGSGTGPVYYTVEYTGGTFWLSKDGPWGDGVNDLTGTINSLTRNSTVQYVGGIPQGAVENVSTSGLFDDSSCILEFVINNNVGLGDTDFNPPLPADYPPFIDTSCAATRTTGSWGDVRDISMLIDCVVPAVPTTWGNLKSLND